MPPPLLFDLRRIDLGTDLLTREEVYERLPHRFEFMLLDGVCYVDSDEQRLVAYADVTPEERSEAVNGVWDGGED